MYVVKWILKPYLITLIILLTHQLLLAQDDKYNLRFDTLSADEALKIQRDFFSYQVTFDSTQIELFYKGEIVAIVPGFLRNKINQKFIKSSEWKVEPLNGNRSLLKVQLHMNFKQ